MDKTLIAVAIFDKLAKVYQNKFMDVSLYSDSFDFFCNNIDPIHADILEIACGPGNISQYLLNKRPGFKLLGTDLSPHMIKLAAINNPQAEFQLMDCREIGQIEKKYDGIMCGFCLPYLPKEATRLLIKDCSHLLKQHGLVYLSTMEDDYSKSDFKKGSSGDEIFMHYYPADYLIGLLKEHHFDIIHIDRKVYQEKDGINTTDLILIAKLNRK
jgi:2-polyprenyl-3-methyl-5-hydroxy-6-metoxy-1,4-benzoquinol methylase